MLFISRYVTVCTVLNWLTHIHDFYLLPVSIDCLHRVYTGSDNMHNHSRIMAEKREMGKLNFHSLFQKVDKLEDGISFCHSYNLLPKSV